jgi:uncharacterized protein YqgV (UPF0045/DUF77 family)
MIVEIQCLPTPAGTDAHPYAHVDAAIARIAEAGVRHEVGALGTTFEAPPDRAWQLARAVHEACLAAGAESVVTIVKVAEHADAASAPGMDSLVEGHRG